VCQGFPEIQSKYDADPSAFALSFHSVWKSIRGCERGAVLGFVGGRLS
jgi:hypothetical protein